MTCPAHLAALALLFAAPLAGRAQINTEAMRNQEGWTGVRGEFGGTVAYASGNTRFLQIGAAGRMDLHTPRDASFVVGELRFSRADGERFVDRSFLHARYTRPIVGPLSAEGFGQVEQNAQQLLAYRYLVGSGLRLSTAYRPRAGVAIGVTPMLEHERLSDEVMEAPATNVRVSSYLSGRVALNDRTGLTATVYAQPRIDDLNDARFFGQAVLHVQATRWVALRMEARVRHDTRPPEGVKRTDVSLENGLVLTIPGR